MMIGLKKEGDYEMNCYNYNTTAESGQRGRPAVRRPVHARHQQLLMSFLRRPTRSNETDSERSQPDHFVCRCRTETSAAAVHGLNMSATVDNLESVEIRRDQAVSRR